MSQKFLGPKKIVPQKLVSITNILKVPKIWVKLNFGKKISIKEVKACKKSGPKCLVKIRSVTAEIFLIWTNVAGTNVAWTNDTVTVEISFRQSQEPTFKVWSKLGQ